MARGLTQIEIDESRSVFADSLDYNPIRIYEGARWPDWIARAGAKLGAGPAPTHNAVTLGNRLYFPTPLRTLPDEDGQFSLQDMAWLIHEITHAWQYQMRGWSYLWVAIKAQIRLGSQAYKYGWEQGLKQAVQRGDSLDDFNPEQQGEIARHFYYRQKQGLDTQAWDPFVIFLKNP